MIAIITSAPLLSTTRRCLQYSQNKTLDEEKSGNQSSARGVFQCHVHACVRQPSAGVRFWKAEKIFQVKSSTFRERRALKTWGVFQKKVNWMAQIHVFDSRSHSQFHINVPLHSDSLWINDRRMTTSFSRQTHYILYLMLWLQPLKWRTFTERLIISLCLLTPITQAVTGISVKKNLFINCLILGHMTGTNKSDDWRESKLWQALIRLFRAEMIDVRGLQTGAYVSLLVRQILNGRPVMIFFFLLFKRISNRKANLISFHQ